MKNDIQEQRVWQGERWCQTDEPAKKEVATKDKQLMKEETTKDQGEVFAKTIQSSFNQISSRREQILENLDCAD